MERTGLTDRFGKDMAEETDYVQLGSKREKGGPLCTGGAAEGTEDY